MLSAGLANVQHTKNRAVVILTQELPQVIVGVDTHADTHHVAVVTEYGKPIADQNSLQQLPATASCLISSTATAS